MKKIILLFGLLILISILFSCSEEQENENPIQLSDFIIENYTNDAKLLYMHEIFNNNSHFNYNESALNENEIENILEVIQAVYNLDIPEKDTIFNLNEIHARFCYSFNSIILKVNIEASEIINMIDGIIPTGNIDLDTLLNKYNFDKVDTSYGYPSFPWLTVIFSGEYNMIPIKNVFDKIPSVISTELNSLCVGDGNSITLERNGDISIITFNIGAGDCPAGCIYHKYWEFKVVNNIAEFVRTYQS